MKLKHLTLRGFKSFADRTRLDFTSGVNVVVGPNGSGKSNILDAIAWVMGTQATKSLRTEKMEDVVFAGTETRPPLPRAEVSLTFANDEQLLPLGLAEITITRRLFRDGSSEYELNGAPCRLLDIQDLLSDGGIGKQQHILVGQGQVGDILNASAMDHRAVIEEAAGVTKHRSRRDRSVRRLERTDIDVERLNDILAQQRKALRPLKRQANAALRHDSVRDEALALQLWLGGEKLRALRVRIEEAKAERVTAASSREVAVAELVDLRDGLEVLRSSAGQVGDELRRDTAAAARLETVRERFTSASLVARERSQAISSRLEGADERREDLETEAADLNVVLSNSTDRERAAIDEVERRREILRALEDEERALAEQIQLPTEGVVATMRGDLRSLETAANRDRVEADQIEQRILVVADRISDENEEADRLNREIRALDGSVTAHADRYERDTASRESAEATFDQALSEERKAQLAVARSQARVDALEAALEGLVDDRAVAIAVGSDGVIGAIVEQLDVPVRYGPAVDAALGAWRSSFVTHGADPMRAAIEVLKSAGTGGVSFVLERQGDTAVAQGAADRFGVETLVSALGKKANRSLAAAFLGDVVVVEGWNTAWEIVEAFPDVRVVTPEGDIVTRTGVMVAQPDGAGPAALEGASVELETVERDLTVATGTTSGAKHALDEARLTERQVLDTLESSEAKLGGLSEALGLIGRSRNASQDESLRLSSRLSAITDSTKVREDRISTLRSTVAEFEGEEAARQLAWEALNTRRAEVATQRDEAQRGLQEATGEVAVITERKTMSESRLAAIEMEQCQLTWSPASQDTVGDLNRIDERAKEAVLVVTDSIARLRVRQRVLRDKVGATNQDLVSAEAARESLESTSRSSSNNVNTLDIELAELRVRDEATCESIRREADATESQALSAEKPDLDDDANPVERLNSLAADLRRMGPINPLAAEEYEKLAAASQELEEQLADLNQSRNDLKKVIAALDEKMVALFEEAFEEIAAFYQENFALVFPGGKGELHLETGTDSLSAGVLVQAQPAGKKVGKLSLLSGGERSLAALAFLFAVFRARPSPFYVLDEVEAALDDANLHRFLRLVDTLSNSVQLLIITHQQQTMESADVLYGVTMEPGESSKVISKRMASVSV